MWLPFRGNSIIIGEHIAIFRAASCAEILADAVTDRNLTVEKNQHFRLDGLSGACDGTVYTFAPEPADLRRVLNRLADYVETDRDLRGALRLEGSGSFRLDYDMDTGKSSPLGIWYGSYTLSVPYTEASLSLDVQKGANGTDHSLRLRAPDYLFDYMFSTLDVTVTATSGSTAKKPSARAVDITDYDGDELEELFETLWDRLTGSVLSYLY